MRWIAGCWVCISQLSLWLLKDLKRKILSVFVERAAVGPRGFYFVISYGLSDVRDRHDNKSQKLCGAWPRFLQMDASLADSRKDEGVNRRGDLMEVMDAVQYSQGAEESERPGELETVMAA